MGTPADAQLPSRFSRRLTLITDGGVRGVEPVGGGVDDAEVPIDGSPNVDVRVIVNADDNYWPLEKELRAQFIDLDGMTESSTPEYAQVGVFGRAEPIRVYAGTSARDIPVTFIFQANSEEDLDLVKAKATWLEALKYPYAGPGGDMLPPPTVFLLVGQHLRMRSILTHCEVSYGNGWTPKTLKPQQATVKCVFSSCGQLWDGVGYQRNNY
jgi:hypothetical protein